VIVADVDGAVVVPRSIATEAEEVASTENDVRDAVRNGMSPVDA